MPKTEEDIEKADKGAVVEIEGVVGSLDEMRVRERLTEMCERVGKSATECELRCANGSCGDRTC